MVFNREKWLMLCRDGRTCVGVSSLCRDGKHVVMLDYDGLDYDEVAEDVQRLQHAYRLPDAVLLETKNGFHTYILAKFSYGEVCEIVGDSKCDEWFKSPSCRKSMKQIILRISPRGCTQAPRFLTVIPSRWHEYRKQSLAHYLFLRWLFGAPLRRPWHNDGSNKVLVYLYKTLRS
jgi:hypothetical protein